MNESPEMNDRSEKTDSMPVLTPDDPEFPANQESPWKRRRISVPRDHGALLIEPPRNEIPVVLQRNLDLLRSRERLRIDEKDFGTLRRDCRVEVLQAAGEFTSQWAEVRRAEVSEGAYDPERPLFVSGHQPQLVHPGAWCKNLLLGAVSADYNGIGLNLVVDNDLVESASINVPTGSRESPRLEKLPFDTIREPIPWEEATVVDHSLANSFAKRAIQSLASWGIEPVLPTVWSTVEELMPRIASWGELLTAARNRYERTLGIENLELPISRLSELDCFVGFVADLLRRLHEFHEIHNQLLREFREVYRIRSATHPVPALGIAGEFREAPFWVWKRGETRRHPLMVRTTATTLALSSGNETIAAVSGFPDRSEDWRRLLNDAKGSGWKIRPRALTTTLFARIFLSDLFIHGIGGAHYDEITNRLCSRFYGIPAPEFLTVSSGQLLPLGAFDVSDGEEQRIRHELRDLSRNPERHHDGAGSEATSLARRLHDLNLDPERRSLLTERREMHLRLSKMRDELRVTAQPDAEELKRRLSEAREQLRANRILKSREFSFALFPEKMLQALLRQIKSQSA